MCACKQIRRLKCINDENEITCEHKPSIEHFCQVAQTIQTAHGLRDEDVRFFLAADEAETYTKVRIFHTSKGGTLRVIA